MAGLAAGGEALLDIVRSGQVEPPSTYAPTVPSELETITMKLLAPRPEGRYDTARELTAAINRALRTRLSPRHVPDRIVQVSAIPHTLSGKRIEVPVKKILMGVPVEQAASRESLANPEALELYRDLPQLAT